MKDKRIPLILAPVVALIVLAGINVYTQITWTQPWDGVIWKARPEGLTAVHIEPDSPAALAGLKKGDLLYQINDTPVSSPIDVAKNLWIAEGSDQRVTYQIPKEGLIVTPSLSYLSRVGPNLIYFFLSLIALTTLAIGLIIFLSSKKPFSIPYIFFFGVSLTFSTFYIFSPTGKLDLLDSVFYWLDKTAFLAFPPLLLHFFLLFPKRNTRNQKPVSSFILLYIPALILLLAKIFIHLPNPFRLDDPLVLNFYQTSEKIELLHFLFFSLATFGIIAYDSRRVTNQAVKRQLKWIGNGLAVGIIPFSAFYLIPFIYGSVPSAFAELTVVLQALLPLTFSYSISRYKLVDLEVLLKKAFTLFLSYVVIAILYFIVSSQTELFSENRINAALLGVLAIVLGATLLGPLKKLFQSLMDRVIYKKSYQYRKTLLTISQELSRERNLEKLSQSLLELIGNALSLQFIALLLPLDQSQNSFFLLQSRGQASTTKTQITFNARLYSHLRRTEFLSLDTLPEKREFKSDFRELYEFGFFHLMPLKVEDELIGCLGMGKKVNNTYLGSEDWELLRTISTPVALALENAYLYNQAQIRAGELERLKDYSENIIESLTVGVAVIDTNGQIIGWNRVLEDTFGLAKADVINRRLRSVLGQKNFEALFPKDTHQDYRLLSEISIEMPRGGVRIFDITKTPLLDNNFNPYGTIVVFEDITEKHSLQQQLLTSEKLASIGLLSAGVAHEINTPLTGISSYIQILQKKLKSPKYTQILGKIETQTDRVGRIVKSLLNFARNPSDSAFYQVDLEESLKSIISLIDYKLKKMDIRLELDLAPVRPIWAQGERLQQVFINIILNALDAMPRGGLLRIELFESEGRAVIKIKDTGTGIKDQHLPHIFDPFFTTKGIGKGTGLGLSISYAIINEHEGYIKVESKHGQGSMFTISLPLGLDKKTLKTSPIV